MHRAALVVGLSLVSAAAAFAAPRDVVTTGVGGTELVRQVVPATAVTRATAHTIYLNRSGITLRPGSNDARANTSTLVKQPTTLGGWDATPADWAATVACVRTMWSRFDVEITDVDPGNVPHIEAVFGGSPEDLGRGPNVVGVSPFASDCGVIESSIVVAFTDNLPADPGLVCEVISQEIGHSYGLDHVLDEADPMSYLPYAHDRAFQDRMASCGEHSARPCGIGATSCRSEQNSVQLLLSRVGAADGDRTAPTLAVTPSANGSVEPGFVVTADATDDVAVARLAVYIDGKLVATSASASIEHATDVSLALGAHVVLVEATDTNDNVTVRELQVTIDESAGGGCSTSGGTSGLGLAFGLLALRRRR